MKEILMDNYIFSVVQDITREALSDGVFILLFHVDKVPPHLGLCVYGRYFSITMNKQYIDQDIDSVLRSINAKNIKTIFQQVLIPSEIDQESIVDITKHNFEGYKSLLNDGITCLQPISDTFVNLLGTNITNVDVVFDVMDEIKAQGHLGSTFHSNLSSSSEGEDYSVKRYTLDDVNQRIQQLESTVKA